MASEKQIKLAAGLYDMRDQAKRMLGTEYKTEMDRLGGILKRMADSNSEETLATAIQLSKQRPGIDPIMLLAAAVELCEPTIDFKVGMTVLYHPIIGGEPDYWPYTIRHIAKLGHGESVAWLTGKSGCVVLSALSLPRH